MSNPTTAAALRRKVERLEAQLQALQDFMERGRKDEYQTIHRAADMAVRIQQATRILQGADE
jgi:hypothetical protein